MQKFHNILYISQGVADETDAMNQAIVTAFNNKAQLKILIVCPKLPSEMLGYKEKYEDSLIDQLKQTIQKSRSVVKVSEIDLPITINVQYGSTPAIGVIRRVLKNSHDLLIKEAETKEDGKGFMAFDMELLRKCPCPLWLCRPISKHRNEINVAVAIDPIIISAEAHNLALQQLKLSRYIANTCNGELNVVSCWDYEFENHLRNNIWIKMNDNEVDKIISEVEKNHRTALDQIINQSNITGKMHVHHLRGKADTLIPEFVKNKKIDILLMGTVARSGIEGFIIGNTAENILQKIQCSLLAIKPNGFISPVKSY